MTPPRVGPEAEPSTLSDAPVASGLDPPGPYRSRLHLAVWGAAVALAALIFMLDLKTPRGVIVGVLYVGVILVGLRVPAAWFLWVAAAGCSALIMIGYLASPEGVEPDIVLINRLLSIAAVWVVAVLGFRFRRVTEHRAESRFRQMVTNARLGMFRSSSAGGGRFAAVNPALVEMLGYDSERDLLGVRLDRDVFARPEDRAALLAEDDERAWRGIGVEVEWRKKTGESIMVRLSGVPILDARGHTVGFDMIVRDVTHERQLEAQLRQAQKMEAVGQLTGGIAHDFNNLLTVILSNAELIRGELTEGSEALADLQELRAAAGRGAVMIRRLLAFSRREMLHPQDLDPGELLDDLGRLLRRVLPSHIEITMMVAPEAGALRADRGALEQILVNLATNARDAMPEGGTLRIECHRATLDAEYQVTHAWVVPGEYVCFAVSDTGMGMDEPTRERVFEPFFTTKARGEGTGLGMAMVYGLVKQHQGIVHVYSELGHGTTIRVYLPAGATGAARHARPSPTPSPFLRGDETILVVEDDPAIRRATERVLMSHGYTVLLAADGGEGLALVRQHGDAIALVLCDLIMPRVGGREFAETVRREGHPARILFTSGYSGDEPEAIVRLAEGAPVLRKPWSLAEMLARVRQVLDRPRGGDPPS